MKSELKTSRISVTLPVEMLEDFKIKSQMTGLSISRLIYLRLRSRKPILVVNDEILGGIAELKKMLVDAQINGYLPYDVMMTLDSRVRQIANIVDFDNPTEIFHIRKK